MDTGRSWERHPLCTCPEATFSGPPPDLDACRAASPLVDPHPVLSAADLAETPAAGPRLNAPISTRPQDWEPRAREILAARGAWGRTRA